MYCSYFGFKRNPFTTAPDPEFFYPTAKHKEALACLLYAVERRKGFALITGEVGAGKTLLCRTALTKLNNCVDTALISHTSLTAKQVIQAICAEFELPSDGLSKLALVSGLHEFLITRLGVNRNVVIIIDEAQNLNARALEEVRMLGNLETDQEKLIQIILVGQPELRKILMRPELRQLNQRIAVKFHLYPLSRQETFDYIDHRLRVAGTDQARLFGPEAKNLIFEYSNGVPRLINMVCDQSLLQAYVNEEGHVSRGIVEKVISEIEGYYLKETPASEAALSGEA